MPIAPSGIYTGPTGSTNSTPGQVIRSATWNTINTDVATALTQLAQQVFLPIPRTVASGSFTVAIADTAVLVKGSSPTIVLPLSSTKTGTVRIFGDAATVFGSANALVIATSPDTISGSGTVTLTTNYQVAAFYPLSSGGYIKY